MQKPINNAADNDHPEPDRVTSQEKSCHQVHQEQEPHGNCFERGVTDLKVGPWANFNGHAPDANAEQRVGDGKLFPFQKSRPPRGNVKQHNVVVFTPKVARGTKKREGFEMLWFRLIVLSGFGLLGLVAALASIAQGLQP